jgi:hypothetical protein
MSNALNYIINIFLTIYLFHYRWNVIFFCFLKSTIGSSLVKTLWSSGKQMRPRLLLGTWFIKIWTLWEIKLKQNEFSSLLGFWQVFANGNLKFKNQSNCVIFKIWLNNLHFGCEAFVVKSLIYMTLGTLNQIYWNKWRSLKTNWMCLLNFDDLTNFDFECAFVLQI